MVTAFHTTRRGASQGITFSDSALLEKHLRKMRQSVRVLKDGEIVGGVYKLDGHWVWFYDTSALTQHALDGGTLPSKS
jgi:hypothetical protein